MMMINYFSRFRCFVMLITLLILTLSTTQVIASSANLLASYDEIKPKLEQNAYGIPIHIVSNSGDQTMLGEVYGILNYRFHEIRDALVRPENWCEIAPQHLNIKACTSQHQDGYCELTFYTGRKFYEAPEEVYQIQYRFMKQASEDSYLHINLNADDGPMGTANYRIVVEAIPLDDSRSFIHFSYTYQYNFFTELGMDVYLATLGRDKVGFSVTRKDENGEPIYVDGIRGIIERNAVRYYLAIQSYLDTLNVSEKERFKARINTWFDLTERHHRQLYEMDKKDYLEYKHLEHKDQMKLQEIVNATTPKNRCPPK